MPVKKQPKNILIIIGLIIAFCVLVIFSIITIVGINNTRSEIESVTEEIEKNQIKLTQLTQLAKNKDQYERTLELLVKLIPNQADESKFINLINNLAQESAIELTKIEFGDRVVNSNNMNVMPVTLMFNGAYENIVKLLGNMGSCERLIRIDDVGFEKNDDTDSVSANIEVRTFYR